MSESEDDKIVRDMRREIRQMLDSHHKRLRLSLRKLKDSGVLASEMKFKDFLSKVTDSLYYRYVKELAMDIESELDILLGD